MQVDCQASSSRQRIYSKLEQSIAGLYEPHHSKFISNI